jgi:hypothetical protein
MWDEVDRLRAAKLEMQMRQALGQEKPRDLRGHWPILGASGERPYNPRRRGISSGHKVRH